MRRKGAAGMSGTLPWSGTAGVYNNIEPQQAPSNDGRSRANCEAIRKLASSIGNPMGRARGSGVVFVPQVEAGLLRSNQRGRDLGLKLVDSVPPAWGSPTWDAPLLGDASAALGRRWTPLLRKVAEGSCS